MFLFKKSGWALTGVLALACVAFVELNSANAVHADTNSGSGATKTITVIGHADKSVSPDSAVINAGVTTHGATAAVVETENNAAVAKIVAALKGQGISSSDIQTQWYNINPTYGRPDSYGNSSVTGFQANNSMSVTIHNVNQVGSDIDLLVKSGANQINGVNFEVSNSNQIEQTLYSEALDDAKAQASAIASKLGATITGVESVDTTQGSSGPVLYSYSMQASAADSKAMLSPGQQDVSTSVKVVYTITD